MGRHRCAATSTVPTLQTLRRIRALSEDRELEIAVESGKSERWDREWDFEGNAKGLVGTGLIGSGIEIGERIGEKIPGLRGTAAFLTTLRANLALTTSLHPPDSPTTTASSMPSPPSLQSSTTLPPPSPLSASPLTPPSSSASNNPPTPTSTPPPAFDLPPLTTTPATTPAHKHAALKLIADSLAQRRQTAAYIVITSPAVAALSVAAFAVLWRLMYTDRSSLPLLLTTFAGVLMVLLVGVRGLVAGYLELAEKIDWAWLGADEVWVTLWGREEVVVGTVVVRGEKRGKRKRGVVRAWTVRLRERGRGVGRGLLEEVARVGRERGWEGVEFEHGGVCEFGIL
ncbi:hypothetical protein MMC13_001150 [Lambiella insularis]|nr:hypothetical protein [Lambiella insularis]